VGRYSYQIVCMIVTLYGLTYCKVQLTVEGNLDETENAVE